MILTKSHSTVATILGAAEDLFLDKNYADVTMGKIAEAASVTKGALYHHFSSKEELYLAMLHGDLEKKRDLFRGAVESTGTVRQRLGRLTKDFLDLPRPKRRLIRLVRRDINIFRDNLRSELIRAYQRALPEQVESILRDGIRDGELIAADTRFLSWYYVALVEITLSRYADRSFEDRDAKLKAVLDLFLGGAAES